MKEWKNLKIIGVDHGYGNIKTANTVTPTGIQVYETEPTISGNSLEYHNRFYCIGEGHKEFVADKALDEDYYILTLMAMARELNVYGLREANVHLAAGLPLTWDRFGVKIEDTTVEQVLRFGTADIGTSYLECIKEVAVQSVADVFATLRKYEYNPDLMRLYIVGGGGCLVKNFGQYDRSRVSILDDICATAKGYEYLALAGLKRKD